MNDLYDPNTPGPYTAPPQPPAPKRRRISRVVLAVVAICTLGIIGVVSCTAAMFNGAIGAATNAADPAPVIMPTKSKPLGTATPTTRKPVEKAPTNNLPRDGVLLVGPDLKPGTYQATCPEDSIVGCYWARLKDTDGELESVLANNVVGVGGTITLRVKATDYAVEIRGGATWKRAK